MLTGMILVSIAVLMIIVAAMSTRGYSEFVDVTGTT
jgi:hypothetical protein